MPINEADQTLPTAQERATLPPKAKTSAKSKKGATSVKRTRRPIHERMAALWVSEDKHELGMMTERLLNSCRVQDVSDRAAALLSTEEADRLVSWLRWRVTWERYLADDMNLTHVDMFAVPLFGTRASMDAFVGTPGFSEQMVSLVRRAGMDTENAEFVFLRLPFPLRALAYMSLDGIGAFRSTLEDMLDGIDHIKHLTVQVLEQTAAAGEIDDPECILLGVRRIVLPFNRYPRDLFHDDADDSDEVDRALTAWGEVAGPAGTAARVFIGFPRPMDQAVSFCAAEYVERMMRLHSDSLSAGKPDAAADSDLHVYEDDRGLWLTRVGENITLGPVLLERGIMDAGGESMDTSIFEPYRSVTSHDRYADLPGGRAGLNQALN